MNFWSFKNDAKEGEGENIELRIDGDIIDDSWAWIYEWYGEPASSPNAFREELKQYAGKDITVWIDSYGGDVFAAAGIYNALKEHNGKVTVKIDGKAMSAASVIAMAGREVYMSPVAIMMIHNPLTYVEGDARNMRKTAEVLDEVKETIINAYQQKTGRSRNKISQMMDDETYMSARTAITEGFADGMLYSDNQQPQVVENSFLYSRLAIQNSARDNIKRFMEEMQKREKPPEKDAATEQLLNTYQRKIKQLHRAKQSI